MVDADQSCHRHTIDDERPESCMLIDTGTSTSSASVPAETSTHRLRALSPANPSASAESTSVARIERFHGVYVTIACLRLSSDIACVVRIRILSPSVIMNPEERGNRPRVRGRLLFSLLQGPPPPAALVGPGSSFAWSRRFSGRVRLGSAPPPPHPGCPFGAVRPGGRGPPDPRPGGVPPGPPKNLGSQSNCTAE